VTSLSPHDLSLMLEILIQGTEDGLQHLEPEQDLPHYLYCFYDDKKFFSEKWRDVEPENFYRQVQEAITKKRPDVAALVTMNWSSVPSFPGRPSSDPQRGEAINFLLCDRDLKLAGAMMKLRRRVGKHPVVKLIQRGDEFTGEQVDRLRTAMTMAHLHTAN